jgi:hypothetical protein
MERVLLDEVITTDYGQFDLVWSGVGFDGDVDKFFRGQVNGLVGAADSEGVYINLARRSGGSRLRISWTGAEPPLLPSALRRCGRGLRDGASRSSRSLVVMGRRVVRTP